MTEFPEIKRAQETPTFLEDGEYNGDPIYEVENIKEERNSRAVWARAIAKKLCPFGGSEYEIKCGDCNFKTFKGILGFDCGLARELLAQAEADEK